MSDRGTERDRLTDLRIRAASRLTGAAATKGPPARAADALAVLHALASSPATASDALALLHELQVHQVELDLQAEELRDSRAELESALRRQVELYEYQPFGCFTIDAHLVVHELNQPGAAMLGIERDEANGLSLGGFLSPSSKRKLEERVSRDAAGATQGSCLLDLCPRAGGERPVRAHIGADPATRRYFLALTNIDGEDEGESQW